MDMYEVFAQNPLLAILRNVPKEITLDLREPSSGAA